VNSAKMAEPTEMQFGLLSRVGPGNSLPNAQPTVSKKLKGKLWT